jgi:hypothetical protein
LTVSLSPAYDSHADGRPATAGWATFPEKESSNDHPFSECSDYRFRVDPRSCARVASARYSVCWKPWNWLSPLSQCWRSTDSESPFSSVQHHPCPAGGRAGAAVGQAAFVARLSLRRAEPTRFGRRFSCPDVLPIRMPMCQPQLSLEGISRAGEGMDPDPFENDLVHRWSRGPGG